MIKRIINKKLVILMCVLFFVLLIESFHTITIPQSFILFLTMLIPFFLKDEEIVAYIICFSILGTGIQIAYVSLSCILNLLFKNKFKMNLSIFLTIGLFLISEFFSLIKYPMDSLAETMRYVSVFFIVVYSLSMSFSEKGKKLIVDLFIISTTFTVVLVIIETLALTGWNFNTLLNGTIRLGYSQQLGGKLFFSADPNLLGQNCALVFSICLIYMLSKKYDLKYITSAIICLLAGALTISKTFLLSLLLTIVLLLFFSGDGLNLIKSFSKKFRLLLLVGLLAFSMYRIYPTYLDNIINRVDTADITTGRVEVATKYLNVVSSNMNYMFFGVGIQNVGQKTGIIASPHSSFIELYVCWGIVGIIYVCSLIIHFIKMFSKSNNNLKLLNYVPLIIFIFVTQTTQLFRIRDHILSLIVIIIVCGIDLERRYENV